MTDFYWHHSWLLMSLATYISLGILSSLGCFSFYIWLGLYLGQRLYRKLECICSRFQLEENEEYIEREDEFDLMPKTEKVKEVEVNQDEEVDIMTVEKGSAFSDSDASQEELCFLPVVPSLDVPKQQDKYLGSSSKLGDSTQSGSPFSEAGQNGPAINPTSSQVEVMGNSMAENVVTTSLKRKRKPSVRYSSYKQIRVESHLANPQKPKINSTVTAMCLRE
uniref:Retinoblastoma-binding protein 5 n=1 Tax=Anthurium amnicola TaxID=1678845 RepID=A0A1D1Y2X7_9ARAE